VPTDDTDLYGSLTYDVALGARNALSASYSYVRPQSGVIVRVDPLDPEGPPRLEEREPYHAATLGLIHRRGATLAFEISAGVAGDSDESTGIGAVEVRRTGDVYTVRVRYDRTLAALGSDPAGARTPTPVETGLPDRVASDSVTQGLRLGVEVSLTDRWQLEQSVWLARTDLEAGDELETLALSGRLVFRLASRVGLFGEVDYFDQGGLAGPFVSSRLRYGVGLVFSVAGPGGERGLLAQRESALRVLPNRGGT
jgi:hypothetical protein